MKNKSLKTDTNQSSDRSRAKTYNLQSCKVFTRGKNFDLKFTLNFLDFWKNRAKKLHLAMKLDQVELAQDAIDAAREAIKGKTG